MMSRDHIVVDCITSLDEAARLERQWDDLLPRASGATPFQSPAWLLPWYAVWAPDRVHILAVRNRARELIAVLPGTRNHDRLELAGGGISDYLAPIVAAAHPDRAGKALDRAVAGWRCEFHHLPAGVPWPAHAGGGDGWHGETASICPVVALPSTSERWRQSLPAGLRRNIRRYGSRIRDEADAMFRTVRRSDEVRGAVSDLFVLHTSRWHQRRCPGVFADSDVRRFHEMSAPRLFDRNLLRLHLLSAGDATIGVQYVLVGNGRAFAYIAGFDPGWSRYSPGTLLLAFAIESAIEEGCVEFDLLRGTEPYKYIWGAVDRPTLSFTLG